MKTTRVLFLSSLIALFVCSNSIAAPIKALGDLNKLEASQTLPFFAQSGSLFYFARTTEAAGDEPWVTDGTPENTRMLKDIFPGPDGSGAANFKPAKVNGQSGAYFFAGTEATGLELWITDGTEAGTTMVKDINPGAESSVEFNFARADFLTIANSSAAFFAADDGTHGRELWVSDGTPGGTNLIQDLVVGTGSSDPQGMILAGFNVVFSADASMGRELYKTNGVTISLLSDIKTGSSDSTPSSFILTTSKVLFAADNGTNGRELWGTDLVTTALVADTVPGMDSSTLFNFSSLSPTKILFASAGVNLLLEDYDIKLFTSDGTGGGTTALTSLDCAPGGFYSLILPFVRTSLVVNGHTVFPCANIKTQEYEPWVTDGTAESTKILKDILPGAASSDSVALLRGANNLVFFANDGVHGFEPWVTDGTTDGTTLLLDLNNGESSSSEPGAAVFGLLNTAETASGAIFNATIGRERKIYYTDGTVGNTRELFDDGLAKTANSNASGFTFLGKNVVFTADDTKKGTEIFVTNGKPRGTKLLKNLRKSGDADPTDFRRLKNNLAVFLAKDNAHGEELWMTDGTKKRTKLLKDIQPDAGGSLADLSNAILNGKLFFYADDGTNGQELWVTNGKPSGTVMLKDIKPGAPSSAIDDIVKAGNRVFFVADDGTNGEELWASDGTSAGTAMVTDIFAGADGSDPSNLIALGDKVYFRAFTTAAGNELWTSDGTAAGTVLLKDIDTTGSSFPSVFVATDNFIFFVADDGNTGNELWRTDGTPDGTVLVEDIRTGPSSSSIVYLTRLSGDRVVFVANDGTTGSELWTADATVGSATQLLDIFPGSESSDPANLFEAVGKSRVYFSANRTAEGRELWKTDGTTAGTVLVSDINPGDKSSDPNSFASKGKKLYFAASTETTGDEPYVTKID